MEGMPMAEVGTTFAPRRFRLLVFDWDGTLADSTALIAACMQQAFRDIGLPAPDEAAARHVIGLGLDDAMRHVAPTLPRERYPELAASYRDRFLARDADIPLYDGVREMLEELDSAGFLLAVATGKSRAGLARTLARNEIAHRFVATRCADEGFPKPHPDMLLHLMERLGAAPSETLMIGDTTHDLELAMYAGASAVAIAHGAHSSHELERHEPLATVYSIGELREWLRANA
jgi:phosphoglycolate phosphatase